MKNNSTHLFANNRVWSSALAAVASLALVGTTLAADPQSINLFNRAGNLLISDQFNNRVIEVNPAGDIVWSFGRGPNDFSAQSVIGVNDAERVDTLTLMAGTGTPPAGRSNCMNPSATAAIRANT